MMTFRKWVNSEYALNCDDYVEGYYDYIDDNFEGTDEEYVDFLDTLWR